MPLTTPVSASSSTATNISILRPDTATSRSDRSLRQDRSRGNRPHVRFAEVDDQQSDSSLYSSEAPSYRQKRDSLLTSPPYSGPAKSSAGNTPAQSETSSPEWSLDVYIDEAWSVEENSVVTKPEPGMTKPSKLIPPGRHRLRPRSRSPPFAVVEESIPEEIRMPEPAVHASGPVRPLKFEAPYRQPTGSTGEMKAVEGQINRDMVSSPMLHPVNHNQWATRTKGHRWAPGVADSPKVGSPAAISRTMAVQPEHKPNTLQPIQQIRTIVENSAPSQSVNRMNMVEKPAPVSQSRRQVAYAQVVVQKEDETLREADEREPIVAEDRTLAIFEVR